MRLVCNDMTIMDHILAEKVRQLAKEVKYKKDDNRLSICHIRSVQKGNPFAAINEHEKYLKKHPSDYIAVTYFVSALIEIGQLDIAEKELKRIIDLTEYDRRINQENKEKLPENIQKLWENIAYTEFRLLCNQNKVKEALEYFFTHKDFLKGIGNIIIFYLKRKNGKLKDTKRESTGLFNQVIEYREEDLRKIVNSRKGKKDDFRNSKRMAYFNENFPVDAVIDVIREYFATSRKLYTGFMNNTYIFRCDKCGIVDGKEVNFFKVDVFFGTTDIYAMEPVDGYYNLPEYYDFTEFATKGEVKKIGTFGNN